MRQTLRSWIFKAWMFLTIAAAAGYLLYSFGAKQEGGWVVPAHNMISELLRWILWGSATLIIVLASGAICAERGNLADSVLCRGISRYQYFLGKWHARLFAVLGTYFIMAGATMVGAAVLLHGEHLQLGGCLVALATVAAILALVITCGVSVSALSNNTVVSIAIVWITLYGVGFLLSFLPEQYPSPDRVLQESAQHPARPVRRPGPGAGNRRQRHHVHGDRFRWHDQFLSPRRLILMSLRKS